MSMIDVKWNKADAIKQQALRSMICYHYKKAQTLLELQIKWVADALLRDFTEFDGAESLIAFYDEHSAKPADVIHNAGFQRAVIAKQRAVDIPHER